jgi:hypothetical protein
MTAIPELRTFRERLSALADGSDPLGLQRVFAKATLQADPPESPLYYLDDHFVAYTGGQPVANLDFSSRHCGVAFRCAGDHEG